MPQNQIDESIGEYLIPNEDEIINGFVKIFQKHFKKHYQGKRKVTQRAIHAKSHGVLRAQVEIINHGDQDLQFSIFKTAKTFDALVRVSNGDGPAGSDTKKLPSIGFAIKVLDVHGEKLLSTQTENAQDFLFINQPAYLTKDIRGYKYLMRAIDGGIFQKLFGAARNLSGILYRRKASPKDNPLNTFYWSASPFKLGNTAIKYLIRPDNPVPKTPNRDPDGLKVMLKNHVENKSTKYGIYIQKRLLDGNELKNMPIEDWSVIWDEQASVPIRVGSLIIPQQKLDEALDKKIEHRVFSPWNSTKDFKPLGSLNRARRVIYEFSSRKRLEMNKKANV